MFAFAEEAEPIRLFWGRIRSISAATFDRETAEYCRLAKIPIQRRRLHALPLSFAPEFFWGTVPIEN